MTYTKAERQLYTDIKAEAIEEHGETPEQAEIIARDHLYYTRRDKLRARYDKLGLDYRGQPTYDSPNFK